MFRSNRFRSGHTMWLIVAMASCMVLPRRLPSQAPVTTNSTSPLQLRALLVARLEDCQSRLEFAHVFERRESPLVLFDGLVLVNAASDLDVGTVQALFPHFSVARATSHSRRLFAGSRDQVTPVLILYSATHAVRVIVEAPSSAEYADRLARWIAGSRSR